MRDQGLCWFLLRGCQHHPGDQGLGWQVRRSAVQVELFFKSKKYASGVEDGPGWHTYLKKGYAKKVREMDSFADVKGVKDLTKIRTLTEEGFKIYGEDELKINQDPQATFTEDCPFDCQCCF
eukprot:TRINITY_DN8467_c0_g1_i5.p1 TRINITY_DN8467_c0_g1~~TRINITY_DN8467_c0_g1_i5.p1  ORF type:complete len:122 (+),score=26.15 TRINITY_DN8467_c0_g1_i5:373-738(+)